MSNARYAEMPPKARKTVKRPVLSSKKKESEPDPLKNDSQTKKFWGLVVESVTYGQFIALDPPLKVNRFLEIRMLFVLDRYWDLTDEEICEKTGHSAEHLATLRANPHFATVGKAVAEAAERLSRPRTFDDWAQDAQVEDRVASELYAIGLGDASPRDRVAALNTFADRQSAKKGREAEDAPTVMLPPNFVQAIQFIQQNFPAAAGLALPAGEPAVPQLVDASVLNVPKRQIKAGG